MKLSSLATSISVFIFGFTSANFAQAAEYKGTCYFNKKSMPCRVIQNPFTKTMIWSDGVTESYSHQGNGIFIDARGGVWQTDPSNPNFMEHSNGNRIGFNEQ